jgi:hypothetical protein
MLQLVALYIQAVEKTSQGLERNPALKRKGCAEVDSICLSPFIYKYQVRNWKFINKWIPQNSIPETTGQVEALVEMEPQENAP